MKRKMLICLTALSIFAMPITSSLAVDSVEKNNIENVVQDVTEDAKNNYKDSRKNTGDIKVVLNPSDDKEKAKITDGVVSITKIATVEQTEYKLLDNYKDLKINLNQIETSEELATCAKQIKIDSPDATEKADENGVCNFKKLPIGVYFITVESKTHTVQPVIVALPRYDEEVGNMMYELEVMPKSDELPKDSNHKDAPQTNGNLNILYYAGGASICVCLYAIINRKKRHK